MLSQGFENGGKREEGWKTEDGRPEMSCPQLVGGTTCYRETDERRKEKRQEKKGKAWINRKHWFKKGLYTFPKASGLSGSFRKDRQGMQAVFYQGTDHGGGKCRQFSISR